MTGKAKNMPTWELTVPQDGGRAEIADPTLLKGLSLSDAVALQIRRIEESVFTAEQRLGTFLVG
jgi:hypothetical protein